MVITHRVLWSARAKNDLRTSIEYVKFRESVGRAMYVRDGLLQTVSKVAICPTKHRIEPIFNHPDIRFAVKWRYKIVYQVTPHTIRVLSIFHTAQSPAKLLE
jgi:plasmid stabilization system protein ParE